MKISMYSTAFWVPKIRKTVVHNRSRDVIEASEDGTSYRLVRLPTFLRYHRLLERR
jgi:hypothetical protein